MIKFVFLLGKELQVIELKAILYYSFIKHFNILIFFEEYSK